MKRLLVADDDAHALYSQFNCRPCKLASPPKDGVGRSSCLLSIVMLYTYSVQIHAIYCPLKREERDNEFIN